MNTRRWVVAAAALAALSLTSCGWMGDMFATEEEPTTKVTFKGRVAVPDVPEDYAVLTPSTWLAFQWYTCYQGANDTSVSIVNGQFMLESTNNCSSAQYVYFYAPSPVDMKAYAQGTIQFKIQVNNASQHFTLIVQDAQAVEASVNLANYGYDSNNVSVEQLISVPVTALTGPNLSQMVRLFQLNATCNTSDCYTTLSNIRWVPPATLPGAAPYATSARRIPRCDPGPCRGLPRARVGVMQASQNGWTAVPADSTTTDAEGYYTLRIEASLLVNGGPFFIGATNADGTATLLSTLPGGSWKAGASFGVDVDRSTTAVGMMVCPNGMTIPADGSGGWCIGDPVSVTELDSLAGVVDESFTTTVSLELEVFWDDVIDDADVVAAVNTMLTAHGEPTVTLQELDNLGQNISIPVVPVNPISGGTSGGSNTTGGTIDANKQCSSFMACQVCSISACAASNADGSTCSSWYETSNGQKFQCAACGDCQAAAQQVTQYCCPTQ